MPQLALRRILLKSARGRQLAFGPVLPPCRGETGAAKPKGIAGGGSDRRAESAATVRLRFGYDTAP
jgi:hypothetical protein